MILRQIAKIILQVIPGSDLRYLLLHKSPDGFAPRLVTPKCELVIDGFPRSANTWVYYNVQVAFPEARIAHHVHSWQQLLLARLYRVPSFLLVRSPDASVQSLVTKRGGSLALSYMDYILTNGLSSIFAKNVWFFEDLVEPMGLEQLIADIAGQVEVQAAPADPADVQDLMERRTNHKNIETPPLCAERLGLGTRLLQHAAHRLYDRLHRRSKA